jgi:quinol monooxygenase YgiN
MVIVAGRIRIRAERRSEAVAAAVKMMRATEQEAGCRAYRFTGDLEDPTLFHLFEEWADEAALQAHFQTPHMAEFNAAVPQLVAAPPSIDRYDVASKSKMM